jgi:hypothetical protein
MSTYPSRLDHPSRIRLRQEERAHVSQRRQPAYLSPGWSWSTSVMGAVEIDPNIPDQSTCCRCPICRIRLGPGVLLDGSNLSSVDKARRLGKKDGLP